MPKNEQLADKAWRNLTLLCGTTNGVIVSHPQFLAAINCLLAELDRLREGRFTEEEFQGLCHQVCKEDGPQRFAAGCI
jgi:hypothetical protein